MPALRSVVNLGRVRAHEGSAAKQRLRQGGDGPQSICQPPRVLAVPEELGPPTAWAHLCCTEAPHQLWHQSPDATAPAQGQATARVLGQHCSSRSETRNQGIPQLLQGWKVNPLPCPLHLDVSG